MSKLIVAFALTAFLVGCGIFERETGSDQVYQGYLEDEDTELVQGVSVEEESSQVLFHLYFDEAGTPYMADFTFEGKLGTTLGQINTLVAENVSVNVRGAGSVDEEIYGRFAKDGHNISFVGQLNEDDSSLQLDMYYNLIYFGTIHLQVLRPRSAGQTRSSLTTCVSQARAARFFSQYINTTYDVLRLPTAIT